MAFLPFFFSFFFILWPCTHVSNATTADPNQTPQTAASDQGLHYLPMSSLWVGSLYADVQFMGWLSCWEVNHII